MADKKQEPKQTTPKCLEIPVPKRREFMDALRWVVKPKPKTKPKPKP